MNGILNERDAAAQQQFLVARPDLVDVHLTTEELVEQGLKDKTLFFVDEDKWQRAALMAQMQGSKQPSKATA